MELLSHWWGVREDITVGEISARAAAMFFVALTLVRVAGMRPFGKSNAYDVIIVFLMGGILSRGIVGATAFVPSVAGATVIILIHKLVGKASFFSKRLDRIINGEKVLLYKDGILQEDNMKATDITESNIHEQLRTQLQKDSLAGIKEVYMEKTGEISFIEKNKMPRQQDLLIVKELRTAMLCYC